MTSFRTNRFVPYSPDQMFDLVADVENYPAFLPLCKELTIGDRVLQGGETLLVANMVAGYGVVRESFKTIVRLAPERLRIDVSYVDGPFSYLENEWIFKASDRGCEVLFFIDYEFRSKLLGVMVGGLFDEAFRLFSDAFENRARVVYGDLGRADCRVSGVAER